MQFAEALDRMESLLEEERLAIRRIEIDRVVALADEKQSLMAAIEACNWRGEAALHGRFRSLVAGIRDNGVLLAHARNCVRDVIQLVTSSTTTTYGAGGSLSAETTGRRVSIDM